MRFMSLFSGIEAASVAWNPLGWEAVSFAEIEPFPCAVLAHHYPDVPNFGDVTKFKEWPHVGAVDVVCGGSPCQPFSVAGLRQGLADPRGNLALTFLAIVDRYRPRYVVWENVPGVLSSNGGRDFASFLGGLGQLGYGWCYRVLDAQYARVDGFPYAVPQRRRRVVVVGYFGDWRRAAAVLSEPESVLGDTPPRREAGERVAPTIASRPTGGGGLGTDFDLDGGLTAVSACDVADTLSVGANQTTGFRGDDIASSSVANPLRAQAQLAHRDDSDNVVVAAPPAFVDEVAACVTRGFAQRLDFETENFVAEAYGGNNCSGPIDVAARLAAYGGPAGRMDFASETFVAHSLRAEGFDASEDGTGRGTPIVPVTAKTLTRGAESAGKGGYAGRRQEDDDNLIAYPMTLAVRGRDGEPDIEWRQDGTANAVLTPNGGRAGIGVGAIAYADEVRPINTMVGTRHNKLGERTAFGIGNDGDPSFTLSKAHSHAVQHGLAVRRLTPVECARLQGFPDYYLTQVTWRGKSPPADGPMYKALGNSWAVNVFRWVGRRIEMVEEIAREAAE